MPSAFFEVFFHSLLPRQRTVVLELLRLEVADVVFLQINPHPVDLTGKFVLFTFGVVIGYWKRQVAADVHCLVGRKDEGHGLVDFCFGDLHIVDMDRAGSPTSGRVAFEIEVITNVNRASGQFLLAANVVVLAVEPVMDVLRRVVLYIQRPTGKAPTLSKDDAIRASIWDLDLGRDRVRTILDVQHRHFHQMGHARIEGH